VFSFLVDSLNSPKICDCWKPQSKENCFKLPYPKQRKLFSIALSKDESVTRKGVEARPCDHNHHKNVVKTIRLVTSLYDVAKMYLFYFAVAVTMLISFAKKHHHVMQARVMSHTKTIYFYEAKHKP